MVIHDVIPGQFLVILAVDFVGRHSSRKAYFGHVFVLWTDLGSSFFLFLLKIPCDGIKVLPWLFMT
jgi:hypothetical protein